MGQASYQGRGSNPRRGFGRGHGNLYDRGRGRGFNTTKPKVRGKCEALGSDVYLNGDAKEAYKYTKMMESTPNYIKGNFN